jgi:phage FluMu gp28-like protein
MSSQKLSGFELPAPQKLTPQTAGKILFPYQQKWYADKSRKKIWDKSRRIGATWVVALEAVMHAARQTGAMDVWFSSADDSASGEFIRYCAWWIECMDIAAKDLGEIIVDHENDIKARSIEFASGKRIYALSSNPKGFRSKGGMVILDELAFHESAELMWKAALPCITWGFPLRILSTHNGKGCKYYQLLEQARKQQSDLAIRIERRWSVHRTTIQDAVDQGLADRIESRELTQAERLQWIAELESDCGDADAWEQEYCCNPVDEATAWLTWDMIDACGHEDAGLSGNYQGGSAYLGMDIGRKRHLTVFWVIEKIGDIDWCREVSAMFKAPYEEQDRELARLMGAYNIVRACIDASGIGNRSAETYQNLYGARVEPIMFTAPVKLDLATIIKSRFEQRRVRIPVSKEIRIEHHSVKKLITAAGNARFDAEETDKSHADRFWAHALALHAADEPAQSFEYDTVITRSVLSELGNFGW